MEPTVAEIVAAGGLEYVAHLLSQGPRDQAALARMRLRWPTATDNVLQSVYNLAFKGWELAGSWPYSFQGRPLRPADLPRRPFQGQGWRYETAVTFFSPFTGTEETRYVAVDSPTSLSLEDVRAHAFQTTLARYGPGSQFGLGPIEPSEISLVEVEVLTVNRA